jgi:hypothetical protein
MNSTRSNQVKTSIDDLELFDTLQRGAIRYFIDNVNPANGLVADSTWEGAPSSIAAVGLALASYTVAVERGLMTRAEAIERTLTTLRFFHNSAQGPEPDTTGYKGFYYHFLDMKTGQRSWKCELSTIDTACLIMGMLANTMYFDQNVAAEREIRMLADALYQRVDWHWALNGEPTVSHGWKPESGFLKYCWEGLDEALFLYVLGLGSPLHPLPKESYTAWTSTFRWERLYGYEFVFAAPLFVHQFPHIWIDFRGIQDDYMRQKGLDYFENSRRATYVQQQYAIHNPQKFIGYNEQCWGITASEGPGGDSYVVEDAGRNFFGYYARGVPEPDDGTLSPWVVIASLPFSPEIVIPTVERFKSTYPQLLGKYGFTCSLNPTFRGGSKSEPGWMSKNYYGINEGPNVLMIENFRTGLVWRLLKLCPYLMEGLHRAGFKGGWLDES